MSGDARARLRQYLEQRRDAGESELVLDRMSVDEVLRVLGARQPAQGGAAPNDRAPAPPTGDADALAAPADHPRLHAEDVRATPAPSEPAADLPTAPDRVGNVSPAALDAAATGDWRAALNASDSPQDSATPPVARSSEPMPSRPTAPPPAGGTASPIPGLEDVPIGVVNDHDGGAELFGGPTEGLDTLERVAESVRACTRCKLYQTARNGVPGEGNPNADFVVVGEAPGAEEDATGRPFVGASGQLLTKILAAINLRREDVFICNVVKHRPPGNRNPETDEVAACSPYLVRQLELVRPKVILTVGNFAAQTLLGTKLGISKLRGQIHLYRGIPLVATYHPAALLRNPAWKRPTWDDVQLARRLYDRAAPGEG